MTHSMPQPLLAAATPIWRGRARRRLGVRLMLCFACFLLSGQVAAEVAPDKAKGATPGPTAAAPSAPSGITGYARRETRRDGAEVMRGPVGGRGTLPRRRERIYTDVISPGSSPGCINDAGNVTFSASATLIIELGGPQPCTQHDRFGVAQTLTIQGARLRLVLIDGFRPIAGQRFDILNWNTLNGTFSSVDTSTAVLDPGLSWDLGSLYTTGEVIVVGPPEPTTVPLPSVALAALGALLAAAGLRRLR